MNRRHQIDIGRTGRMVFSRIGPNEDLVLAVEKICIAENIHRGFVRGSLGSLTDTKVSGPGGRERMLRGPAIEVVGLSGEIRPDAAGNPVASLNGVVVDPSGRMTGGSFVRGQNPVCVTFEIAVEEWISEHQGTLQTKSGRHG